MNELTRIALDWLDKGVAPLPIKPRSKAPMIAWRKYQSELPTRAMVEGWFKRDDLNLAVICGWRGLTVIDFDDIGRYVTFNMQCSFPKTYSVLTSRGVHMYYWINDCPQKGHNPTFGDIQGLRSYVLAPPSIHPSGAVYRVFEDYPIASVDRLSDVLPEDMIPITTSTTVTGQQKWNTPPPPVTYDNPFTEADNAVRLEKGDFSRAKAKVKIEDLFPNRKCTDKKRIYWQVACPFHGDHNPSADINLKTQRFHCHLCKEKPQDVIHFLSRVHNIPQTQVVYKILYTEGYP